MKNWCIFLSLLTLNSPVRAETMALPEEVARLEELTYARSPLNNQRLTLGEYAQLQEQLQTPTNEEVSPALKQLITLLRLRKLLKTLVPFAPL